jgi:hypothetical protein
MTTLTEFLLARLAEDEVAARGASHHSQLVQDYERDNYGYLWVKTTRVLAEVEAKRRIVRAHEKWCDGSCGDGEPSASYPFHQAHYWSLAALAAVYSDHPDYDEAWKP